MKLKRVLCRKFRVRHAKQVKTFETSHFIRVFFFAGAVFVIFLFILFLNLNEREWVFFCRK